MLPASRTRFSPPSAANRAPRPPSTHPPHAMFQASSHPIHSAFPTFTTTSIHASNRLADPEATSAFSAGARSRCPCHSSVALPCTSNSRAPGQSLGHTPAAGSCVGRLAECEDTVIFARVDEAEKCEFIKANAPEDAWASTDDGAGLLIKASALREQALEMLASIVRF